jgi:hypothetical protein
VNGGAKAMVGHDPTVQPCTRIMGERIRHGFKRVVAGVIQALLGIWFTYERALSCGVSAMRAGSASARPGCPRVNALASPHPAACSRSPTYRTSVGSAFWHDRQITHTLLPVCSQVRPQARLPLHRDVTSHNGRLALTSLPAVPDRACAARWPGSPHVCPARILLCCLPYERPGRTGGAMRLLLLPVSASGSNPHSRAKFLESAR